MAKYTWQQAADAHQKLLTYLQPGDTIYTILRHRSDSGMTRCISALVFRQSPSEPDPRHPDVVDLDFWISRVLSERVHQRWGGIILGGAGMDMGFNLVYSLGRKLWSEGFLCLGEERRCPANDHANERGRSKSYDLSRIHQDGGYALKHRWI